MYDNLKRVVDLFISILLLFLLFPLFIVISMAIILESGLPVFFHRKESEKIGRVLRFINSEQ